MDAIIDVGSNSVRLCYILGEVNPKTPNTTFLSENLAINGYLSREAIDRTAIAVSSFYDQAKQKCDNVYIFATEAVRSATNGNEFCDKVYSLTGKRVHVISGNEEALCGFVGSTSGKGGCVIDVGGASIEMIEGKDKIDFCKSIPYGVRRAFDTCGFDQNKTHAFYKQALVAFEKANLPVLGIGGTATSLSALNNKFNVYDAIKNHGSILTISDLEKLEEYIYSFDSHIALANAEPVLDEKRALVLGTGCIAFIEILKRLKCDSLTVSEADNAEGYYKLFVKKN